MKPLDLETFLKTPGMIFDVRSPGEFSQGRIPGAHSLPLFTDAERAIIGTLYKQSGKEKAIHQGLKIVGPKLSDFVTHVKTQLHEGSAKVHCWRGGMRSASMAWLLQTAGLPTVTLKGGYKIFRRWCLEKLKIPLKIIVLSGLTGSGKTSVLHALKATGEQVLDLEGLAHHRGSSYGMLNQPPQPTTEQFENEIALHCSSFDSNRTVWVEDESHMIGRCKIPDPLFHLMRSSQVLIIQPPIEERIQRLHSEYGKLPEIDLIMATERIAKRLGGVRTNEIVNLIREGKLRDAIEITLQYYDAAYHYAINKRNQPKMKIEGTNLSSQEWAELCSQTMMRYSHAT